MTMIKSLVLGSAAGLIAMSGAQAADLPVKAKAVEYVRICSLYGAGFYYIPGTDTCIKLGGYLRMDVLANTNSDNTGNMYGGTSFGTRQPPLTNASVPIVEKWWTHEFPDTIARSWTWTCPPRSTPFTRIV